MKKEEIREMMCQYIDGLDHLSFKETENFCKALHQKFEEYAQQRYNEGCLDSTSDCHKQALIDARINQLHKLELGVPECFQVQEMIVGLNKELDALAQLKKGDQ